MKSITYSTFVLILLCILIFLHSCSKENKNNIQNSNKLFLRLHSEHTNLKFNNSLLESDSLNYFNYPYMYMGGGVAVGDFNNDNLLDVYFTGNTVKNELYINQSKLSFKNITKKSKTGLTGLWCNGVTTVDINNDGLLDIYISVSGKTKPFNNKLLINQGNDNDGFPIFKEEAKKYGIDDSGHSIQSVFFDYDNDGDLDLYVINYPITNFKAPHFLYAEAIKHPNTETSSHLYKNNGNNSFTDVTKEANLLSFGLSIGVSVSDLNNDGYKDIYVSNDFSSPDFIYFNNGDGTFTEKSKKVTQQTSFYGMGTDIADFNNDGLFDIVQLDMSPSTHKRSKENMASMDPKKFQNIIDLGLHHQYMYNSLQLNRGFQNDSLPVFSNIAAFSGVKSTDWSWGVLFADFNNNGHKDIIVSNGIKRDINNNDFFNQFNKKKSYFSTSADQNKTPSLELLKKIPSEPLKNYIFKNNGDLTFTNKSEDWGVNNKTFSNGLAYADFDNDGDLDLVINNIDEKVSFYENRSNSKENANYLKIKFKGIEKNKLGIGNTVKIYKDSTLQIAELMLTRGYQSSVAPELHFGVGNSIVLDSLVVQWTDGKTQLLTNVKTNQSLTLNYTNAKENTFKNLYLNQHQQFVDITNKTKINFKHEENSFDDYLKEPLLPHKMSQFGPGLSVGDVNGDDLDDFWIGGAFKQSGAIFLQRKNGLFDRSNIALFEKDKNQEDIDGLFFDVDKDGDLDLYVVSGGNEFIPNSREYRDRLYINDGKGNFTKNETAIPEVLESGAKVISFDFDKDGDLDLFIGSKLIPQFYPTPPNSHLLENVSTKTEVKFIDVTNNSDNTFNKLGLITDAISIDFDNDNDEDLIVVGEWMPITFLENNNNTFTNITDKNLLKNTVGWWYSIEKTDMDNDGDQDFIVGNLGLNYKYKASPEKTFDVYANDFDNNKSLDIVLGYYQGKTQYPVRGRECSSQQVPGITKKFKDYEKFANANLVDIYTENKLENGIHYKAQSFASVSVENLGNGTFKSTKLPNEAQFSSINTILSDDFNGDGKKELLVAGNLFVSEAETPRNDASIGLLLNQTENGFDPVAFNESGFFANKDVKNMKLITINGKKCILIANNDDELQIFEIK